jgi:hypothetical protein
MARWGRFALGVGVAVFSGCGGTLDAGRDIPHGILPVDERNPVILENDHWGDNWMGEYAMLLANSGGPPIAGIIASASPYWPNANDNAVGWGKLVGAARASGLQHIPDVTMSAGLPLARPADGQIRSTVRNDSAGAKLIVELSRALARPTRPLVVLACAPLTTIADAYLIDETVVDRVVVVAMLGELGMPPKATMDGPNGDLDPWADWIVAQRFRYVQISAYYDQGNDVAANDLSRLPRNPIGDWMADKQPDLFKIPQASDQIAPLSVALPTFAKAIHRAKPDTSVPFDPTQGPPLLPDEAGNAWVVTQIDAPLAASRLWEMLLSARTFGR